MKKNLKKKQKIIFRIISACLLIIALIMRLFFVNRFVVNSSYLIFVIIVGLLWIFEVYLPGDLEK